MSVSKRRAALDLAIVVVIGVSGLVTMAELAGGVVRDVLVMLGSTYAWSSVGRALTEVVVVGSFVAWARTMLRFEPRDRGEDY